MGQGFSLATPSAGSAGIDIAQLQDIQYEKSIGNARFMKSIRGRHENGVVLVKVLVKPFAEVKLDEYKREILKQTKALSAVPNALAFERVIETETNGHLVRQYMYSSLYDRLSTRPFLEDIEKKWLAFQLLCALRDCHARDVYHGDIKAQNVLVTSWNWLYLTDFSSCYKPVVLPDDNPGDFSYFFDTSGRRTCYLAPERFFHGAGQSSSSSSGGGGGGGGSRQHQHQHQHQHQPEAKMTWAMDIFSAGCVIAQLFLESELFSLAQLFKYRRGEYDPVADHVSLLADADVRDMIAHMIQLDPEKRYSADQYLDFWKGKVFPAYFYTFLHQYMELITHQSSGLSPMSSAQRNLGESDDRIDRVFHDFDKISFFLGSAHDCSHDCSHDSGHGSGHDSSQPPAAPVPASRLHLGHFPLDLSMANHFHFACAQLEPAQDDGTLIFLNLIVSSIRTTARASSRVRACDILLAFAERLTDEAKLDRVLPYVMTLLRRDEVDIVLVSAIRTITQLLQLVRTPTPINSHVLVEYVLPRMEVALASGSQPSSPLVRATYASCLGSLASSGQRFLEVASTLGADGSMPLNDPEVEPGANLEANFDSLFDTAGRDLADMLESHAKQLVEDPDVQVRRAFLTSVPELCMFFREQANDILLTHLNTYLNDRDWTLKCAFFDTVVAIAVFIGSTSLEEFMLPLMVQALADAEEFVVQAALHALAQLAGLGLLSRPKIWELADLAARFTMHPSIWIRESAAEFLAMSAKYLDASDVQCILMPSIKAYLRVTTLPDLNELTILDALKAPLSRPVFEQAVAWATQSERGLFWKPLQEAPSLSLGSCPGPSKDLHQDCLSKMSRNDEDNQWLEKLRNLGLKADDEFKLVALAEYIWRTSRARLRDSAVSGQGAMTSGLVSLKAIGITPQTVFFNDAPVLDPSIKPHLDPLPGPYTIAEALLDASMAMDDLHGNNKKRAALRQRVQSIGPGPVHSSRQPASWPVRSASRLSERLPRPDEADADALAPQGSLGLGARRGMRHQPSVLSLLDGKDNNSINIKSPAETGTSDAKAFGQVEGPFGGTSPVSAVFAGRREDEERQGGARQCKHSYEGRDPHIQKMLDRMYTDNFPRDVVEFGPMVQPVASSGKVRAVDGGSAGQWRPQGHLVATFAEHRGAINRVVASPDHVFFVTAGSDGAVKVWDTARLERNITQRSRQTHRHGPGARVVSVCFVENSHCFISCASDGSIHVVKVDTWYSSGVVKYGKLRVVREYELGGGEYGMCCEHFRHDSMSVLVVATNRSRVVGLDLRTMGRLFVLDNPVHHGTPTSLCVDRKRNWLCVGTCHGIVSLWDLRFKMRLKSWGLPGKRRIHRMSIHPTKGRGKWICVAGGTAPGEMTVWDVERTRCREIYRIVGGGRRDGAKTYSGSEVDADLPGGMLASLATDLESSDAAVADGGVRAMAMGMAVGGDGSGDVRHAYFTTGGSDCKLRFWDMTHIDDSRVYSGLEPDEPPPTYSTVYPAAGVCVSTEKKARHVSAAAAAAPSTSPAATSNGGGGGSSSSSSNNNSNNSASGGRAKGSGGGGGGRPARSTVISMQQQHLLQSHQDAILDMAVIEYPYTMSVSVDRSGVVFVFQ
ncbi:hypothetical protein CDD82_4969 [Ophiocordyceps australis]|uniref:non-specific serine/threonine protein kinase n=1 Tax=Ophiocordyceps australis TaxID=1399860 RepID=A0A2C5Z3S4_9HYPO|nr:hypothetical protein CDD82_4969 [Ophiocordyceps australis]